jgi:hypothetical protein
VAAIIQHRGQVVWYAREQVPTQDHDCDAGGPEILLGMGVNQGEVFCLDRPGQEIGRHVAYAKHIVSADDAVELKALDGLIGSVVQVGGVGVVGQISVSRQVRVRGVASIPDDANGAFSASLGNGLAAPVTADDVVSGPVAAAKQGHGNHRELQAGAALKEQHFIAGRQAKQQFDVVLGFVGYVAEPLAAVAHAKDGKLRARRAGDGLLRLQEDGLGQRTGTPGEVMPRPRTPIEIGGRLGRDHGGIGLPDHELAAASMLMSTPP